jgi:hypothetical protein
VLRVPPQAVPAKTSPDDDITRAMQLSVLEAEKKMLLEAQLQSEAEVTAKKAAAKEKDTVVVTVTATSSTANVTVTPVGATPAKTVAATAPTAAAAAASTTTAPSTTEAAKVEAKTDAKTTTATSTITTASPATPAEPKKEATTTTAAAAVTPAAVTTPSTIEVKKDATHATPATAASTPASTTTTASTTSTTTAPAAPATTTAASKTDEADKPPAATTLKKESSKKDEKLLAAKEKQQLKDSKKARDRLGETEKFLEQEKEKEEKKKQKEQKEKDLVAFAVPAPVWPTLPSIDSKTPSLAPLVTALSSLPSLQLRSSRPDRTSIDTVYATMLDRLREAKTNEAKIDALSGVLALSLAQASPAYLLTSLQYLLNVARTSPAQESLGVPPTVTTLLENAQKYHSELDLSAVWNTAAESTYTAPIPKNGRSLDRGNAYALATDGKYLYMHCAQPIGLQKTGTGLHGTIRGHAYLNKPDWRVNQRVHLCHIQGKLYAMSASFWPKVEVLDTDTLESEGFLHLGVDPEWSTPQTPLPLGNPMVTDGRYLYVIHSEEYGDVCPLLLPSSCMPSSLTH